MMMVFQIRGLNKDNLVKNESPQKVDLVKNKLESCKPRFAVNPFGTLFGSWLLVFQ